MQAFSNHPLLEKPFRFYAYIFFWLITSIALVVVIQPILKLDIGVLILDSASISVLWGVLGFFLYYVLRYSLHLAPLLSNQFVNYVVLALLFVTIAVTGNSLILYYNLSPADFEIADTTLYLRVFMSTLVFSILALTYSTLKDESDNEAEIEEDEVLPEEESVSADLPQEEILERIAVKTGQKIEVILVENILYFRAEKDYVMIFTEKNKHLKELTMKSLEQQLPNSKFVRVHRSFIVNVEAISRIELYEKQTQMLILTNGHQVKMSQNGYRLLKSVLSL